MSPERSTQGCRSPELGNKRYRSPKTQQCTGAPLGHRTSWCSALGSGAPWASALGSRATCSSARGSDSPYAPSSGAAWISPPGSGAPCGFALIAREPPPWRSPIPQKRLDTAVP